MGNVFKLPSWMTTVNGSSTQPKYTVIHTVLSSMFESHDCDLEYTVEEVRSHEDGFMRFDVRINSEIKTELITNLKKVFS
jgi:hypothetical protein